MFTGPGGQVSAWTAAAAFNDVPGGPPVDVSDVAQRVLDPPDRAGRDRGVQASPGGRGGERAALAAQSVDVVRNLHANIVPRPMARRH